MRYLRADRTIRVATSPALPVQADGEIVGVTPLEIQVLPAAVRVVVPAGV